MTTQPTNPYRAAIEKLQEAQRRYDAHEISDEELRKAEEEYRETKMQLAGCEVAQ